MTHHGVWRSSDRPVLTMTDVTMLSCWPLEDGRVLVDSAEVSSLILDMIATADETTTCEHWRILCTAIARYLAGAPIKAG